MSNIKLKSIVPIIAFALFATSTYASDVYIVQAGSSSTIDITQTGNGMCNNNDDGNDLFPEDVFPDDAFPKDVFPPDLFPRDDTDDVDGSWPSDD